MTFYCLTRGLAAMIISFETGTAIAVGCLVIYALWSVSRTRWPIRITIRSGKVSNHSGLPRTKTGAVLSFFEELEIPGKLDVMAIRQPNGHFRTKIVGSIDHGIRQRIRNFLISEL